ncbi:TadE family type IV pilus minor pilin [Frigoribacterium sp. CFBP9039]|uniref:TadE family type IV pilus minor pilin n=1 Tax=Frigoribacterium sp. CFBP9029 TaxID=3096541 RepID=UPI002A6B4CF9|nr:TadE family type IV pilus minor pilin [Frigoribacterium sp. CFBP9039]MDY0944534.1 TadE family type IV pilus minor pilin [Frigoribacterium sp. CFBP9039]
MACVAPGRSRFPSDVGSVTAEFAVVVPALLSVVGLALVGAGAGMQAIRLSDAAAVVARQTARGGGDAVPATLAALAPGASVSTSSEGDLVCIRLTRVVALGPVEGLELTGRSCAPRAGG